MTNKEELELIKERNIYPDRIFILSQGVDPDWRGKKVRVLFSGKNPKTKRPMVTVEILSGSAAGCRHDVLPSHCLELSN